jgi:hypothetical protein
MLIAWRYKSLDMSFKCFGSSGLRYIWILSIDKDKISYFIIFSKKLIFSSSTSIVALYKSIHSRTVGYDNDQKKKGKRLMLISTLLSTAFQCTNQVTFINQVYLWYIPMYFKLIHITYYLLCANVYVGVYTYIYICIL